MHVFLFLFSQLYIVSLKYVLFPNVFVKPSRMLILPQYHGQFCSDNHALSSDLFICKQLYCKQTFIEVFFFLFFFCCCHGKKACLLTDIRLNKCCLRLVAGFCNLYVHVISWCNYQSLPLLQGQYSFTVPTYHV